MAAPYDPTSRSTAACAHKSTGTVDVGNVHGPGNYASVITCERPNCLANSARRVSRNATLPAVSALYRRHGAPATAALPALRLASDKDAAL